MADPLRSNTQEQIRALCRKISVAHDLDPEIQTELYGHMEDKLLAYLSGEEQVTEEDAFILVREHFGDPAVLKGLLQDVHVREVHVSLARRLAAAAAATLGALFTVRVLVRLVVAFCGVLIGLKGAAPAREIISSSGLPTGPGVWRSYPLGFLVSAFGGFGTLLLMCLVLIRWRLALEAGKRPWFLRWHPRAIALGLISALLIMKILPTVIADDLSFRGPIWVDRLRLVYAPPVLTCLVWLWWCDRPPMRVRTFAYVLCAWIALSQLLALFSLPHFIVVLTTGSAERVPAGLGTSAAQGRVLGSALNWYLALWPGSFRPIVPELVWQAATCAAIACAIFLPTMYLRRRYAKPLQQDVTEVPNG
jgi:hypothetical protein